MALRLRWQGGHGFAGNLHVLDVGLGRVLLVWGNSPLCLVFSSCGFAGRTRCGFATGHVASSGIHMENSKGRDLKFGEKMRGLIRELGTLMTNRAANGSALFFLSFVFLGALSSQRLEGLCELPLNDGPFLL